MQAKRRRLRGVRRLDPRCSRPFLSVYRQCCFQMFSKEFPSQKKPKGQKVLSLSRNQHFIHIFVLVFCCGSSLFHFWCCFVPYSSTPQEYTGLVATGSKCSHCQPQVCAVKNRHMLLPVATAATHIDWRSIVSQTIFILFTDCLYLEGGGGGNSCGQVLENLLISAQCQHICKRFGEHVSNICNSAGDSVAGTTLLYPVTQPLIELSEGRRVVHQDFGAGSVKVLICACCEHVQMHVYIRMHTRAHLHARTHTHTHRHTHARAHTHAHTCARTLTCSVSCVLLHRRCNSRQCKVAPCRK